MNDAPVPLTISQMNVVYDSLVKVGYQGLADHWLKTHAAIIARAEAAEAAEAESARLREALTVAETLYGGLMADDARALIRAALNP